MIAASGATLSPVETLAVVATINLPGLLRGAAADVDPEDEYIAACLAGGYLVPSPEIGIRPAYADDG